MGEGCGSWFPPQQFDWHSPNMNSLAASHPLQQQSVNPQFTIPETNMVSTIGNLPVYANPELPHLQVGQVNEPRGWFYCLPHFRQAFTPASDSPLKEQPPVNHFGNQKENIIPKAGTGSTQKKFLVFDQSGDQTTLIFSSALKSHIKCPSSWGLNTLGAFNFNLEDPGTIPNPNFHFGPVSTGVFDDHGADVQSEMQEDTEELNALLYSDDDSDYTEDDEVTSTGHSPSTMTTYDKQFERDAEEVASSTGLSKKRKLLDGGNNPVSSLMDTASAVSPKKSFEYEDDADSSCAIGHDTGSKDLDSSSGNKRLKKEKILETMSVLRTIIPDGEGKNAIVVIDEAIDYLKSLKLKAKAFGLTTI